MTRRIADRPTDRPAASPPRAFYTLFSTLSMRHRRRRNVCALNPAAAAASDGAVFMPTHARRQRFSGIGWTRSTIRRRRRCRCCCWQFAGLQLRRAVKYAAYTQVIASHNDRIQLPVRQIESRRRRNSRAACRIFLLACSPSYSVDCQYARRN